MHSSSWDRIECQQGDITQIACDAIVNAANSSLLGGGGVDGAIHRAAGPDLLKACRALGGCPCGQAKLTPGFNLPSRTVIHTVGPVYRDGSHGEPQRLRACYECSLELAAGHGIRTMAFPAISCGVYGYPIERASEIALGTTAGFLASHPDLERVFFILFSRSDLDIYERTRERLRRG